MDEYYSKANKASEIRELAYKSNIIINSAPKYAESYFNNSLDNLVQNNICEDNSADFLEKLLSGENAIRKKEIVEHLINEREKLKYKKLGELLHQKNELRAFIPTSYEMSKIYSSLDALLVDEEIQCWKDVSFMHLKLLDDYFPSFNFEQKKGDEK